LTSWNIDSGKKVTGGKIHLYRKKRRFQRGSLPLLTHIGGEKRIIKRVRGGKTKVKLLKTEFVNVVDVKSGKRKKVKILDVIDHPDNPHFTRRSIITKSCVLRTELGLVKVVSRPSQHGVVNGILIEEKREKSGKS